MALFLFRFWPVLLPLAVYFLWMTAQGAKARRKGEIPPRYRDGPWYWAVLASLLTGALCFLVIALNQPQNKGAYTPPHLEDGRVVPGAIRP